MSSVCGKYPFSFKITMIELDSNSSCRYISQWCLTVFLRDWFHKSKSEEMHQSWHLICELIILCRNMLCLHCQENSMSYISKCSFSFFPVLKILWIKSVKCQYLYLCSSIGKDKYKSLTSQYFPVILITEMLFSVYYGISSWGMYLGKDGFQFIS